MSNDIYLHERIYRGDDFVKKLSKVKISVCGAGAIGSNLIDNLTRQGCSNISVIDFDRVEKHNINSQVYGLRDVGKLKIQALEDIVFRNTDIEISGIFHKLEKSNVKKLLSHNDLVVDCFDNVEARTLVTDYCKQNKISCLHVGLYEDYCEVVWHDKYKVPSAGGLDVCEYPLARNATLASVMIASEQIMKFVGGEKVNSYTFTLKDLKIKELL